MPDHCRVLVSWSSGKDAAWALHHLRQLEDVEIVGLLTTFNEAADRVAMHAVRRELVEQQAAAADLPLFPVMLPWPCSNDQYEERMREAIDRAVAMGVTHVAFGDLFLEDVRDYRIRQLSGTGIEPLFPIWCGAHGTSRVAGQMIGSAIGAVITCVDLRQLSAEFVGRCYDQRLLDELPEHVDPCGERGEFHTFCYAGPHLRRPLAIEIGETVERDGFVFADVLSATPGADRPL